MAWQNIADGREYVFLIPRSFWYLSVRRKFEQKMILSTFVCGHMKLVYPPPRGAPEAGFTGNDIDYNLVTPISAAQYPCKNTQYSPKPSTFAAGSTITAQLGGGAPHGNNHLFRRLNLSVRNQL